MSEFKNVTIVKKANVYFDGKVASRSVIFPDGSRKTLGIMFPGQKWLRSWIAVVWGTMKDHGGYIDVTNKPTQGANFDLYFPLFRKTAEFECNQRR